MENKKRTRMIFDTFDDIKKRIKVQAALRNVSATLLINKAIVKYLKELERNKEDNNLI